MLGLQHAGEAGLVSPIPLADADAALTVELKNLAADDNEYWAFRHGADRAGVSSLYQYPAMMVPKMQRVLIECVMQVQPGVRRLIDPFMGSGTVLREGMLLGLEVAGQDINPLAILLGQTRCGPFYPEALTLKASLVIERAAADTGTTVEADFPGLLKWFTAQAALELSRLRRAIREEKELWARRFFWVTLAETVRLTSNSRTSTYKLHIRAPEDVTVRSPLAYFRRLAERNLEQMVCITESLEKAGSLKDGSYCQKASVHLGDTSASVVAAEDGYDLLVTSPPYGDNLSTVPYGQSSYLPLQWIDLNDIDPVLDPTLLRTTQEVDRRSLGGKVSTMHRRDVEHLLASSATLAEIIRRLQTLPPDRTRRVGAFFVDLFRCIPVIVHSLRNNAYLLWTVGNRRVGGTEIPMSKILLELSAQHGLVFVDEIERSIVYKRMASRNQIASTMRSERTVILRKASPG